MKTIKNLYQNLPDTPGVYLMKDSRGRIIYIGKAGNLKRRVSSYFERPHDVRIEKLVSEIKKIDYRKTDTAIEALILESKLIKELEPKFNIREKDDKSFIYVEFTKEKFPRGFLVRGKSNPDGRRYGPFTSTSSIREALKILRRIFPFAAHSPMTTENKNPKPCFDYQIGLCPGTCIGVVSREDYAKNIANLKLFFDGEKKRILNSLKKDMKLAAQNLEFEKADVLKRKIFALQHIQDVALINDSEVGNCKLPLGPELGVEGEIVNSAKRIEGYDISNISGTSAVGSMVVFKGNEPDNSEYRKFKIRTVKQSDDVGMLTEVLTRRFSRDGWQMPDLILIDGGRGQVNAAKRVLLGYGFKIPIIGIAKGPERKKNEIIGEIPSGINLNTLIMVRNEAHRFAISYHKKLRGAYLK